jgi:hypothetical protein
MPPRKRSKPGWAWRTVTLSAPDVANNTSTPCEIRPRFRTALHKPPIHSLPLEVVSEIFILALPPDYELCKRSQMHPEDRPKLVNPLLFCAVCSLWRSIALSTAQLWKRAFVFVPQHIKKGQAIQKAAYLVRWIERSGSLPLTLHIISGIDTSLLGTGPDAPITSVLNRYAARWETLYHRSTEDHQSPIYMLHAPWSQLSFGFAGWHSLRQICSSHINGSLHEPNQTTPWAQLTDLQIRAYIPSSRAISFFRECPRLVRLSIAVWAMFEAHASPIIQHSLVTLSVTTDHCSFVVSSITLPNLRKLYMSKLSPTHLESLLDFFTRSSCNLDRLVISETHLTPRDHLNLLAHKSCDSLSSLIINNTWMGDPSVDEELVRRLTLRQHDSLCTRLKVLTMTCWIDTPTSALLDMVESRIGSHAGQLPDGLLQYLQFFAVTEHIQKLDEVGMRSGVECTHEIHDELDHVFSIWFRRRGFRERVPAAKFNGMFFDEI